MKDVFLLYDTCCLYEVVILNYFMKATGCEMVFCSPDGKAVTAMEGYSLNMDMGLRDLDPAVVRSFTVPGGDIRQADSGTVTEVLKQVRANGALIGGICAGVDLLEREGILEGLDSTHSKEEDVVKDQNVITARGNAYVDFAIAMGRELNLFADEADLQETIDFWKYHKRMDG